jgi:hypothetical protein
MSRNSDLMRRLRTMPYRRLLDWIDSDPNCAEQFRR